MIAVMPGQLVLGPHIVCFRARLAKHLHVFKWGTAFASYSTLSRSCSHKASSHAGSETNNTPVVSRKLLLEHTVQLILHLPHLVVTLTVFKAPNTVHMHSSLCSPFHLPNFVQYQVPPLPMRRNWLFLGPIARFRASCTFLPPMEAVLGSVS